MTEKELNNKLKQLSDITSKYISLANEIWHDIKDKDICEIEQYLNKNGIDTYQFINWVLNGINACKFPVNMSFIDTINAIETYKIHHISKDIVKFTNDNNIS